jgi:tyrosine-specific transport protein
MQRLLSSIFLVSGTSIGAGMLAQPAAASQLGFIPACSVLLLVWVFMTLTALLIAEASIALGDNVHIVSIAQEFLGVWGKVVAAIVYLFIVYLTNVAYICGGQDLILKLTGLDISGYFAASLFVGVFGWIILLSSRSVGLINSLFFILLVLIYGGILVSGAFNIKADNLLATMNWSRVYTIIPLFLTSFSFQMIVPNLASYLKYNRCFIYIAIVAGTMLSAILYIMWNGVVLGSLAGSESEALALSYAEGSFPGGALAPSGAAFYRNAVQFFSILAIITSFIGLSWGLLGFFSDALQVESKGAGRFYLWILVMLPPLVVSQFWQHGFIGALETTGGYGDAILNGLIPALVFIVGSRQKRITTSFRWLFNNWVLAGIILCSLSILLLEFMLQYEFL